MSVTPCTGSLHIAQELKGMKQDGSTVGFGLIENNLDEW
jgi:hypothetical protein